MTNNSLLNFYREGNEYVIEVRDLDSASPNYYAVKTFRYTSDIEANESDLVLLDDTVLIAPHNKQLNLIDGVWYLNDFKSTTPSFEFLDDEDVEGSKAQAFFVISPFLFNAPYEYAFTLTIGNQTTNISFTGPSGANIDNLVDVFVNEFNVAIKNDINVRTGGYEAVFAYQNGPEFAFYIRKKVVGDFGEIPIDIEGTFKLTGVVTEQELVFISKDTVLSGGVEPSDSNFQTLDQNTDYYYTCRYVYLDGHKTDTCFPKLFTTSNNIRRALLRIDSTKDLNDEYTKIEVFRRKEGEDFFFIGDIIPEKDYGLFIDNGLPNIRILDDQTYVWTKSHQTHEIVRDRYVRANVDYRQPTFEIDVDIITRNESELTDFPRNTSATIYARVKYEDGTLSFHKKVGEIASNEQNLEISIAQNEITADQPIKEVAYYTQYSTTQTEDSLRFTSIELYNSNIPSLATKDEENEDEQDLPIDTHIFLGWKYIWRVVEPQYNGRLTTNQYRIIDYVVDFDYDEDKDKLNETNILNFDNSDTTLTNPQFYDRNNTVLIPVNEQVVTINTKKLEDFFPTNTEIRILNESSDYTLVNFSGYRNSLDNNQNLVDDNGNIVNLPDAGTEIPFVQFSGIYKLSAYDSIREKIRQGIMNLRITNEGYFSSNATISGKEISVVGLKDFSETKPVPFDRTITSVDLSTSGVITSIVNSLFYPPSSRLYAIVSDDDLNRFNNSAVQNEKFLENYENDSGELVLDEPTFVVELTKLLKTNTLFQDNDRVRDFSGTGRIGRYLEYERILNYIGFSVPAITENALIYIGQNSNLQGNFPLKITGYEKINENGLITWVLRDNTLFESIISEDDLRQLKTDYPNQLIWSDPYIQDTNASGNRRFRFESFLNISRQYGEIVSIKYINNILVVFCEKGVALVNVGEVLTQNTSGQTVVASENFLTGEQWILKNVPNIQRNSIKQFESMLFFSDEKDVWMFTGELQNVSQGAVKLASPATHYGAIDVLNKEYRISDGNNTWAYSIQMGQWFGPYTYTEKVSVIDDERLISFNDGNIVEHNQGNRFWYKPYTTTIESVANDLQDPSIDKIFRKLYFEMDADYDTKLSYTKDTQYQTKELSQVIKKNDNYHIGIDKHNKNSKRLFWKIDTTYENFVLRMSSYFWNLRKRR